MKLNVYRIHEENGYHIAATKYSFFNHENVGDGFRRICLEKVGVFEIPNDEIGEFANTEIKGIFPKNLTPIGIYPDEIFDLPYKSQYGYSLVKDSDLKGIDLGSM